MSTIQKETPMLNSISKYVQSALSKILKKPVVQAPEVAKRVQIVYSTDDAQSIVAAATLKKAIKDTMELTPLVSTHFDVRLTEVAMLDQNATNNTYIWVGMKKLPIDPYAKHIVVDGEHVRPWGESDLDYHLTQYIESGEFVTRVMREGIAATSVDLQPSTLHLGVVLESLRTLFREVPIRLNLKTNIGGYISKLSDIQNELVMFYSEDCPTHTFLNVFAAVNGALSALGHGSVQGMDIPSEGPEKLSTRIEKGETTALMYLERYNKVREYVSIHGQAQRFVIKSGKWKEPNKVHSVTALRMLGDFWLVRRMTGMNKRYFHNTRLTPYGIYMTTNIPAGAVVQLDKETTVNV